MSTSRPSLSAALAGAIATLLGMAHSRLELLGMEFEDEIGKLIVLVATGAAILVFGSLALLVASLAIVFVFDGSARVWALAGLALLYALIAAGLGLQLKLAVSRRTPMFAGTLAEFARDRAALLKRASTVEPESSE
jgi:uncharacterized membrane protein YqjE